MGSGAKNKTTMAKLNRERSRRERRFEKQAKKDARKLAASAGPVATSDALSEDEAVTQPAGGAV
jgi:hypothetical protein